MTNRPQALSLKPQALAVTVAAVVLNQTHLDWDGNQHHFIAARSKKKGG